MRNTRTHISHTLPLSDKQKLAARLLASGSSTNEAANAVGVRREAVSGWKRQAAFLAAIEEAGQVLLEPVKEQLGRLRSKALAIVEKSLDAGDLQTALIIFRALAPALIIAESEEKKPTDILIEFAD